MKKAKQRMIIGGVLIALQLLAVMGNALAGEMPSFDNFAILLGYFLFGIIGVVLLIQGIRMMPNSGNENDTSDDDKKEQ